MADAIRHKLNRASWRRRFVAGTIDWMVALIGGLVVCAVLFSPLKNSAAMMFLSTTLPLLFACAYFALCESSRLETTYGKRLVVLKVVDYQGRTISIWHAIVYRLLQCACIILLMFICDFWELTNLSTAVIALPIGLVGLAYWALNKSLNPKDKENRLVVLRGYGDIAGTGTNWFPPDAFDVRPQKNQVWCAATCLFLLFAVPVVYLATNPSLRAIRLKKHDLALKQPGVKKFVAVYAIKDIPEGALITKDALEVKADLGEAPEDFIKTVDGVAGRIAKYTIPSGQMVSVHDLVTKEEPKEP